MSKEPQTSALAISVCRFFDRKYELRHYGNIQPDLNNVLYCVEDAEKVQEALNKAFGEGYERGISNARD